MREQQMLKGLEKILTIRKLQKELAQIEVLEMSNEEALRFQNQESARKELESTQIAWKDYLGQATLNPELMSGYSTMLTMSASEYEKRAQQHKVAANNTKEKVSHWRSCEAKTRQGQRLKKEVSRRIQRRSEEESLRILEERTSFYWRRYD